MKPVLFAVVFTALASVASAQEPDVTVPLHCTSVRLCCRLLEARERFGFRLENLEEGPEIGSDQELMHRGHADDELHVAAYGTRELPHTEDRAEAGRIESRHVRKIEDYPAYSLSQEGANRLGQYSSRLDAHFAGEIDERNPVHDPFLEAHVFNHDGRRQRFRDTDPTRLDARIGRMVAWHVFGLAVHRHDDGTRPGVS
jgi:hypothetical protein